LASMEKGRHLASMEKGAFGKYGEGGIWQVWRRGVLTGFWWENMRGKRSLGRPSFRWDENIKKNLQALG